MAKKFKPKDFSNPASDAVAPGFEWPEYKALIERLAAPTIQGVTLRLPERKEYHTKEFKEGSRKNQHKKLKKAAIKSFDKSTRLVLESYMQEYVCSNERVKARKGIGKRDIEDRYDFIEEYLMKAEACVNIGDFNGAVIALEKVERWLKNSDVAYEDFYPSSLVTQAFMGTALEEKMVGHLLERVCSARAQRQGKLTSRPKTDHDQLFICQLASVYGFDLEKNIRTDTSFIAFCIGAYKELGVEKTPRQIEGLVARYYEFKKEGGKWILTTRNGNTEV